jgi:invasion protein IalB
MCKTASAIFCAVVTAALSVVSEVRAEPDIDAVYDHPWRKACVNETCGTSKHRRTYCGLIAEVALVERKLETGKLLNIVLPPRIDPERPVRITIDGNATASRTVSRCDALACRADHAAGPELVEQLKQGQTLVLEAANRDATPHSASKTRVNALHVVTISLTGFAAAYDGAPTPVPQAKVQTLSPGELRAEWERHKRVEAERKARCGSPP